MKKNNNNKIMALISLVFISFHLFNMDVLAVVVPQLVEHQAVVLAGQQQLLFRVLARVVRRILQEHLMGHGLRAAKVAPMVIIGRISER